MLSEELLMFRGNLYARRFLVSGLIVLAAGLTACSKGIDGKYVMQGGIATVEFKGGKATLTSEVMGSKEVQTADYTQDGDKITVKAKEGDLVFTRTKDGNLEGMLGTFKKTSG
jgi:hypothetical protein